MIVDDPCFVYKSLIATLRNHNSDQMRTLLSRSWPLHVLYTKYVNIPEI